MPVSGANPVRGTQVDAKHDTSGALSPLLVIDHSYFQQAVLVDDGTYHHVVTGSITLTNKGGSNLEDISILVHLGDDADIHSPYFCDALGNQLQSSSIGFPNLAPNQESPAQPYYWSLINQEQGAQEPGPFHVTPRLNP